MKTKTIEIEEHLLIDLEERFVDRLRNKKEKKEAMQFLMNKIEDALEQHESLGYYNGFSTEGWWIRIEEKETEHTENDKKD